MESILDYRPPSESAGDSVSLAKLESKPFTIIALEDSGYKGNPGVKITTKEVFPIDGKPWNKFHTTREFIVKLLASESLRAELEKGTRFAPVYCKKIEPGDGKNPYFILEEFKSE